MNSYGSNNFVKIITADGKQIPYLKSVLTGISDKVQTMIKGNELQLPFSEQTVCAYLTWIDKETIQDNPYMTSYKKSVEQSAKDKAEMVKLAKYLKMKDPEMMFDFIYESFCECERTDEYQNKDITDSDFSMYATKHDGWEYSYNFCILMLESILELRKLADERLKEQNYEKIYEEQVLRNRHEKVLKYAKEKPDEEEYIVVKKPAKQLKKDLFDVTF